MRCSLRRICFFAKQGKYPICQKIHILFGYFGKLTYLVVVHIIIKGYCRERVRPVGDIFCEVLQTFSQMEGLLT